MVLNKLWTMSTAEGFHTRLWYRPNPEVTGSILAFWLVLSQLCSLCRYLGSRKNTLTMSTIWSVDITPQTAATLIPLAPHGQLEQFDDSCLTSMCLAPSVPSLFKPKHLLSAPRTKLQVLSTPTFPSGYLNILSSFLASPSMWSAQCLLPRTVTDSTTSQSSSSTGFLCQVIFFLTLLLPNPSLLYFLTQAVLQDHSLPSTLFL